MLPIALHDGSPRLLEDAAGRPVWPVRMQREFDLLATAAGRVGAGLRMSQARNADSASMPQASAGSVACIEPGLWPEARLYAHLTGRRLHALEHAAPLAEVADLEVLVCSSAAISAPLLHCLYDPPRAVSPGLVYGRTPDELRARVLRGAASAVLGTHTEGSYVQVWPDAGTGSDDERAWVREAVGRDAAVLAVLTHSDGLDAPLAKGEGRGNLLICPIRHELDAAPQHTPQCRHTAWCHRLRLPVAEAFACGELIAPSAFRARVLVWSTCFGALDSATALDRQWSVVDQFNLNPSIDVVLAKWRAAFGHGAYGALIEALAGGKSVGAAVADFNGVDGTRERGGQFAIFGDPRVAAPVDEIDAGMAACYYQPRRQASAPADPAPEAADVADAAAMDARLTQLRLSIGIALRHEDERRDAALAAERLAQAGARLQREGAAAGLAPVQDAALDCFRRYTDLIRGWSPHVAAQRFDMGTSCGHCGAVRSEAINDFAMPWKPRRIGACPRCQIAEDAPADFALDFRVHADRQAELLGPLPPGRFAGIAVVWATTPAAGAVLRWPVDAEGRPLRRMALDVDWPRGTTRVTLWLMFDLDYVTLNHRVTGAELPTLH